MKLPLVAELAGHLVNSDRILWLIDENESFTAEDLKPYSAVSTVVSNRYDLWRKFESAGFTAIFSDFSFPENHFSHIVYPVSKEKNIVEHIFDSLDLWLPPGGKLILTGSKQQGIKSWFEKLQNYGFDDCRIKKIRSEYLVSAIRSEQVSSKLYTQSGKNDYSKIQEIARLDSLCLYSKPGVFGWKKVDAGSQLLVTRLKEQFTDLCGLRILDLGCGWGYLSLALIAMNPREIIATDNNAAALIAIKENISRNNLNSGSSKIQAFSSDCADNIHDQFDLIVCNPPFHKGKGIDRDIGERFVGQAARLLKTQGQAWFVVNAFIGIEKLAAAYFVEVATVHNNQRFKVLRLKGGTRR